MLQADLQVGLKKMDELEVYKTVCSDKFKRIDKKIDKVIALIEQLTFFKYKIIGACTIIAIVVPLIINYSITKGN